MGAYDISFCTLLLQATLFSCQSPFTPVQRETNLKLPYTGNGKDYPRYITKLVTDKKWTQFFFPDHSLCLCCTFTLMVSFLPLCFIFPYNFKHLYSSAQCLLREQNILESGVVGVTSALRRGPKTNINTVKHKCYHLVECIFWLPLVCHSAFTFRRETICLFVRLFSHCSNSIRLKSAEVKMGSQPFNSLPIQGLLYFYTH